MAKVYVYVIVFSQSGVREIPFLLVAYLLIRNAETAKNDVHESLNTSQEPRILEPTIVFCARELPGAEKSKTPLGNSRTNIAPAILAHGTAWKEGPGGENDTGN